MSQLIVNGVVTMSSRDIADLVQSKHSDVKRSAERLVAAGILTAPLAQFDFEHNGNVYQEYRFNKRDSLVIVARLSPEFTAAVVDRWQELEEVQSVSVPRSLPEALRLAADLAEQKEQLTILIERNILYRLGGTLTPLAQHISAGRFEVKTGTSSTSNHAFSQTRFTARGVRWIGGLWAEHIAGGQAA